MSVSIMNQTKISITTKKWNGTLKISIKKGQDIYVFKGNNIQSKNRLSQIFINCCTCGEKFFFRKKV